MASSAPPQVASARAAHCTEGRSAEHAETWRKASRKSYFDADGLQQRDLPDGLSESARRAIEATEVDEAPQLRVSEILCGKSTVHGWGLFAGRDFQQGEVLHESPGRLIEGQPECISDDVFATTQILWEDEVITPTQRRRWRKARAAARRNLWLHRRGFLVLSPLRIAQAVKHLSNHHSADRKFLNRFCLKRTASSQLFAMEELTPWRCKWCYRIMKAKEVRCLTANCGQRWEQCWDPAYVFQPRKPQEWQGPTPPSPSPSRKAKKEKKQAASRENSRAKKDKKEKEEAPKGWGKGKKGLSGKESPFGGPLPYAMSPFAYPMSYFGPQTPQPPWTPPESKGADSMPPAGDKDFMAAIKASYPDITKAPQAIKDYYEKAEAQTSKSLTSEMHRATTSLGKLRKELQQLNEARTAHRRSWLQHLALSAQSWQAQLKEYEQTQSGFGEKIQKATEELHVAHRLLQRLNAQAATTSLGSSTTPAVPELLLETLEVPEVSIGEEVELRKKVQDLIEQCSQAVIVKEPTAEVQAVDSDDDSARERERKRIRGEGASGPNAIPSEAKDASMSEAKGFRSNAYDRAKIAHRAACSVTGLSDTEVARHVHTVNLAQDCKFSWHAISAAQHLASQVRDELTEYWDAAFPTALHSGCSDSVEFPSSSHSHPLDCTLSVWHSNLFEFEHDMNEPCDCGSHSQRTEDPITPLLTDLPTIPENPPAHAPQWLHEGFGILNHLGFVHEHEGPVMNVISWFLHGDRRRETADFVRHRFSWDWYHWEFKLREIWREHIDPTRPLHVVWVNSHVPPRTHAINSHPAQRDHHLIVFQAPRVEEIPALASIVHEDRNPHMIMQEALFVPGRVQFRTLFHRLYLGLFHDSSIAHIRINGHVIARHAPLRQASIGSSIVVTLCTLTHDRSSIDDSVTLMQRPVEPHSETEDSPLSADDLSDPLDLGDDVPSSEDALTHAPEDDLQSTYIHTVGHFFKHALVRWRSHDDMVFDVASLLGLSVHDLVAVYKVMGYPCGTSESSNVIIAHRVFDKPTSANFRFALCDLVMHDAPQSRTCGVNPLVDRSVMLLQPSLTRWQLCEKLGLLSLPPATLTRVLIFLDDELWSVQDLSLREIFNGAYVRAHIPLDARQICTMSSGQGEGTVSPTISFELSTGSASAQAPSVIEHSAVSVLSQLEPGTVVTSWFINHRFHRACLLPRAVTMRLDPRMSVAALCQAWIDLCDMASPIYIHVVRGRLPGDHAFPHSLRPHVIVEQERFDQRTAGLLSLVQSEFQAFGPPLQALSLPSWVSGSVLADIAGIALPCMRVLECHALADDVPLHPVGRSKTRSGALYRFLVSRRPVDIASLADDHTSLMQLSIDRILTTSTPSSSSHEQVEPPLTAPDRTLRLDGITVIFHSGDTLWYTWNAYAATELLEEGPVAYFASFFVTPSAPVCHRQRPIRLTDDLAQWHADVVTQWIDVIDPNHDVHVHLVTPRPPAGINVGRAGHLVILQHPQDDQKVYHLTELGLTNRPVYAVQFAPNFVDKVRVLYDSARLDDCILPNYRCRVWHHRYEVTHEAVPSYDGLGLVLTIQRTAVENRESTVSLRDEEPSPYDLATASDLPLSSSFSPRGSQLDFSAACSHENVGSSTSSHATSMCLDSLIPPSPSPSVVQLDFAPAIAAFHQVLDLSLPTLPTWPVEQGWTSDFQAQLLDLPTWTGDTPLAYQFYTDGSRCRSRLGAGVIMMVVTANGSELGGLLADPAHGTHNGHAEHHAMTWALIWAVQIAKWHRLCYPTSPSQFCFNFDAVTTASLAGGTWAAHVDGDWKRLMRALELLLRSHCGDAIAWNHVHAHQGHLLNEGADSLAKFAATHLMPYEHPFKLWLQPTFLQSLAWAWTLPLGLPVTSELGTHPVLVSPPQASPADPGEVSQADGSVDTVVHHELWLRLATANVLTVGQDAAIATNREPVVGARQTLLMDQFLREKFHVIGIQTFFETDHVIGLAHPALPSGHEGIQLWFNKRDRFCADSRPFARQDLLLVSSAPDSLVVRVQHPVLRCLVICCHAPHSARPPEDLHRFWEELSRCVANYLHLPILFLGDSNAHLGSSVSEVVGDVSPAQENLAGQLFHDWCLSHRVYLPSTFPACHHGPSFTCLYPGNRGGARLDYVGLPCDVSIRSVRSWELQEQQRICPCVHSAPVAVDKPFVCEVCSEAFVDRRLLAQHRFRAHSLHSEESMLIHSTRCGGCLRNFHTSHRMLQHLKYHPNGCLWKMRTFRLPDTPHKASLPDHMKHVARLPCERDVAGPLLPDPAQHVRSQLLTKLWHLKHHPWYPIVCSVSCESLSWLPPLTCALDSTPVPTLTSSAALVHSWLDSCLRLVCDHTDDHLRGGIALFQWIDRCFAGHFAHRPSESTLLHCSDAELIVWEFLKGLDGVELCWTFAAVTEALDSPSVTSSLPFSPAAPSSTRVPQGCGPVPSRFALLADWERTYRDAWQVCATPIPATVQESGAFSWLLPPMEQLPFYFVDPHASRGAQHELSHCLTTSVKSCEDLGPLRDRTCPWGRDMLYAKELSQLHIGTVLLLMALRLAVRVAHTQGRVIVEHPGLPFDEAQASIWWTQLLDLLADGCGLFSVMDIQQFRFGSPAVKPTRLLFANLPLETVLPQLERRDFVRPTTVLAGRRSDGSFATSIAKEYPRLLNLALALCCSRNFPEQTGEVSDELVQKAREFSHFCRDTGGTIQPDYQPQAVALHV
eukprot:Skav220153  [mRNA]  locus=scaffold564:39495:54090:+ [translate_table: standard]